MTEAPGVCNGLGVVDHRGELLIIESAVTSSDKLPSLSFTGNLKNMIQDSIQVAHSFARVFLKSKSNDFLEK